MTEAAPSNRNLALAVGVILVVAVAGAAIFTSLRPNPQLDRSTPEGTVQAFFLAIEADDWDGARALLTPSLQNECEASELAVFEDDVDRALIADVSQAGDETIVEVRATRVTVVDPLSPYTYQDTFRFILVDQDGLPAISELPFQFFCDGFR